jgi:hypothetical protein
MPAAEQIAAAAAAPPEAGAVSGNSVAVFVQFETRMDAEAAAAALRLRKFDGRAVVARLV